MTRPIPMARPRAMKIACRILRRSSRLRQVRKNMAAGLRGRQLHGGYTLSVLLACNRAGGTVGIREGRGEAWSPGRHGADVQRRAASGGAEGLPEGPRATAGSPPDLAGAEG